MPVNTELPKDCERRRWQECLAGSLRVKAGSPVVSGVTFTEVSQAVDRKAGVLLRTVCVLWLFSKSSV